MAKKDDLILRGKALKDLGGIKDVLLCQGDPFLAAIMNRAIECIENQPAVPGVEQAQEDIRKMLASEYGDMCQFCKHYNADYAKCAQPTNGSGSWCCENAEWRGKRAKE